MMYLVAAYVFAVLVLSGFLVVSLTTLRQLSKQVPRESR